MKKNYSLYITISFLAVFFGIWLSNDLLNGSVPKGSINQNYKEWQPKNIETDLPKGEKGEEIKLGYLVIVKTSNYIGPLSTDASKRFAGNNLSCTNCHLNAGKKIGSGSFVGVANRFPQFRGRENKMGTLKERVNGCMERSMNGKMMPENTKEMNAIIAYMEWLSEDVPQDIQKLYKGYKKIEIPAYKADPKIGKGLYEKNCVQCHQENGEGTKIPEAIFSGYTYPPIGGKDSFNEGAGMHRVITSAEFIKSNMPYGATYDNPVLSDEEAFHVAAYINTFERPEKPNKKADFPDKKLKPVSTPYGPWADEFSPNQHKFGPFPPMMAYYKDKYDIKKTK